MKNKEKIIGSIVILFITIIFIGTGYIISSPKKNVTATDYKDVFVETDKTTNTKVADVGVAEDSANKVASSSNKVADSSTKTTESSLKVADGSTKAENSSIKVDIKGAVKNPSVYEIENGSRVTDLIKLAGGGTKDADLDATNLSLKLKDEDCIIISKKGEVAKALPTQSTSTLTKSDTNDSQGSSSNTKKDDAIININTASKEELNTLTGIGDAKADVIIEYREQNGGFKSVNELTKVGGIGEKTLNKFIDKIDIK
ncbi:helix-hairpin-helix domain-containing protein [Clostridium psychrophilum]|uniref:helix-hairpin-helix domain-containing protein n=1 Tax=Clostridium psychrophilum TaxID=132926 RepID=UPI001C0BAD45|nr:helix-hairpin-helix domain-containing protein [Clostridium psychrophilum]MBU3183140.1 helix-hairpin-helix domain-containing protein [Clostridium psychrophilum]